MTGRENPFSGFWKQSGRLVRRFSKDRKGVGAIEFAIIFPLLVSLYITSFELTVGFSVYKRATRAAGSVADLVSQQATVDKAYLGTMRDVASAIFVPYNTNGISLKITGIQVDANRQATVKWSWDQSEGRPYAPNTPVRVPDNLLQPNAFLIHSELSVPHNLLMFMSSLSSSITPIRIGRDYYFAKRETDAITCSNC
ncbi:pilus assembly protein [Agrobacterium larrymoorei]|uniref:TadE/TadG family type IV pilus assembly protein n=1 Tax=Agrobacterium larrymoorei TaxID=160699 RepID=UPI001573996C|nr:TadE/TadG family type IV pilus assembly protein [Agrobacterium larrymoorei]NTJ41154.1 pilus assembly protein [Agrobacterium larrymoorei]